MQKKVYENEMENGKREKKKGKVEWNEEDSHFLDTACAAILVFILILF
jgi:hypothetical protein